MRKLFKKSLACILTAIICVSLCVAAVPASAAAPTYSTNEVVAKAGETVEINFAVSNFANVKGAMIKFFLPEVVASITEVKVNGNAIQAYDPETGAGYYEIDNTAKSIKFLSLFGYAGELASVNTLTFNVKATVASDAVDGTYTYPAPYFSITEDEETLQTVTGTFGKFEVKNVHEHSWSDWNVVAATASAHGSKTRTCAACGETEKVVLPRELKLTSISLTLQDLIAVNFGAKQDYFGTDAAKGGFSNPYMEIYSGGKLYKTVEENVEASTATNRIFTFSVTPQMLNDNLEIYLYATYNGEVLKSPVRNYSIASTYCYQQLGKATVNNSMKTLIVDLLEYASALQIYKNYNTTALANANLTAAQKALATPVSYTKADYTNVQTTKYAEIANPTAKFTSVTLNLSGSIETVLKATLPADISNVKVVATLAGETFEIPSSEFTLADGKYQIKFTKTKAHQLDDTILFTIYDGSTVISNTLATSAESYVNLNIEKAGTLYDQLRPVMATMMNYGRSADIVGKGQ